jgi:hypothetical protein
MPPAKRLTSGGHMTSPTDDLHDAGRVSFNDLCLPLQRERVGRNINFDPTIFFGAGDLLGQHRRFSKACWGAKNSDSHD